MTETDLQAYRQRLLALAARLDGDVAYLRGDTLGTTPDGDDPADRPARLDDLARREAEHDVTITQLASEEHVRAEVEAALARIAAGTFGVCAECGKAILPARLRAVPYARFCVACAARREAEVVP
ncbi:MAG TPA: TraR/DksA family transcriptional regulator [Gemmataceae bacterium]|jgi:RNA polymerase-binding transcription factor DksA